MNLPNNIHQSNELAKIFNIYQFFFKIKNILSLLKDKFSLLQTIIIVFFIFFNNIFYYISYLFEITWKFLSRLSDFILVLIIYTYIYFI